MCELKFRYDFLYAIEEKLRGTVDGIDKMIGVLFVVGKLFSVSGQATMDADGLPEPERYMGPR